MATETISPTAPIRAIIDMQGDSPYLSTMTTTSDFPFSTSIPYDNTSDIELNMRVRPELWQRLQKLDAHQASASMASTQSTVWYWEFFRVIPKASHCDPVEGAFEQASKFIVPEPQDWDNEETPPGYTYKTWQRAYNFLLENVNKLWVDQKKCTPAPRVTPGPDGSVDIHWRLQARELLINIPNNNHEPAAFYGDDYRENSIKGTIDLATQNQWPLMWLVT